MTRAVVLAAGRGTRLGGDGTPKVLCEIEGRPLLGYVLENLSLIPPAETVLVVGYGRERVMAAAGKGYRYAVQEEQLGTGHALKCARQALEPLEGDVLVCYGDMPLFSPATYRGLLQAHRETQAACTVLTAWAPGCGLPYGRVIRRGGAFAGVVEERDCTPEQREIGELNAGVYVFRTRELFRCLEALRSDNAQGEYYLTDAPGEFLRRGSKVHTHTIQGGGEIRGVNTPEDLDLCRLAQKGRTEKAFRRHRTD